MISFITLHSKGAIGIDKDFGLRVGSFSIHHDAGERQLHFSREFQKNKQSLNAVEKVANISSKCRMPINLRSTFLK